MAGGFLAIGSCISALTRNQVVAFVISFVVCFGFNLSGFPLVLDFFSGWAPQAVVDAVEAVLLVQDFNPHMVLVMLAAAATVFLVA